MQFSLKKTIVVGLALAVCALVTYNYYADDADADSSPIYLTSPTPIVPEKTVASTEGLQNAIDNTVIIFVNAAAGKLPNGETAYGHLAYGSGWMRTNGQNEVVTAAHVVSKLPNDAKLIVHIRDTGKEYNAKVVYLNATTDVAVLKIDSTGDKLPSGIKVCTEDAQFGENIWAIGSPLGVPYQVHKGIVSSPRVTKKDLDILGIVNLKKDFDFMMINTPVLSGMSGGPIITDTGCALGMNDSIFADSDEDVQEQLYLSVTPENLRKSLSEYDAKK